MKVWIVNEHDQREQVEIKEDGRAWTVAVVLFGMVIAVAAGAALLTLV